MSCGVLEEDNVRNTPVKEGVPWNSLDEVQVERKRHDGRWYYVVLYCRLGRGFPPTVHSAWRTRTSVQTFLGLNPGGS